MVSVKLLIITTLLGLTVALPEQNKKKPHKAGVLLSLKAQDTTIAYKKCTDDQKGTGDDKVDCPDEYPYCCALLTDIWGLKTCAATCNKKEDCSGKYEPGDKGDDSPKAYKCANCPLGICNSS